MSEPREDQNLADRLQDHVAEGEVERARRIFSRSWREAVPELPQRFPVILVRPDKDRITRMVKRLRKDGQLPALRLVLRGETAKVVTSSGKRVGDLSARDRDFLKSLGKGARLYEPRLLEVNVDEQGALSSVAAELVRPEVSTCPDCGALHTGLHLRCEDCRQQGQRSEKAEAEAAPVAFHDAVAAIIAEPDPDDELNL